MKGGEKLLNFFKKKSNPWAVWSGFLNLFPSYKTNYATYRKTVYRNPSVAAAYTPLQNAFLNIEFKVFEKKNIKKNGKKMTSIEPVENKWVDSTIQNPNPLLTRIEFQEYLLFYYLFGGRNLCQRVDGYVSSDLLLFAPDVYSIEYARDRMALDCIQLPTKKVAGRDLLNFHLMKSLDPDARIAGIGAGSSPLEALGPICDLINYMVSHNTTLVKNKGHKNGLFKQKDGDNTRIGKKQREEFEEKLKEALEGYQKAGKLGGILPQDVEYIDTSVNPHEMDWTQGWELANKMVANIMGVPLSMISDAGATYNNSVEDKKKLYKNTVLPLAKKTADYYTKIFKDKLKDNQFVWFDISAIEELRSDMMDTIDKLNNSKFLTMNDKRAITAAQTGLEVEKYNHPNADKLFVSGADVPIDYIEPDEDEGKGGGEGED